MCIRDRLRAVLVMKTKAATAEHERFGLPATRHFKGAEQSVRAAFGAKSRGLQSRRLQTATETHDGIANLQRTQFHGLPRA